MYMTKLVPLSDHLVVEATPKETQTASGFYIPENKEGKPESGTVIAVGPGRMKDDGSFSTMDINVGDKILFKKYAPDEFEVDGKKVLVLAENDVLAKIQD
jgi:chaperonin GroES